MSNQRTPAVRGGSGSAATVEGDAEHRRAKTRASLEQSRVAFHELVGSLKESDLRVKRPGHGWSVREAAIHVISSIEQTPALIKALRRGHDHLNLPPPIAEQIKRLYTWWAARSVTREVLERRFDAAHSTVLAMVDTVRADEWERGGHAYGEGYWTVEYAFRHQREHVEAHVRQIRRLLERT